MNTIEVLQEALQRCRSGWNVSKELPQNLRAAIEREKQREEVWDSLLSSAKYALFILQSAEVEPYDLACAKDSLIVSIAAAERIEKGE